MLGPDPRPQHLSIRVLSSLLKEGVFLLLRHPLGTGRGRDPFGLPVGLKSIPVWTEISENCRRTPEMSEASTGDCVDCRSADAAVPHSLPVSARENRQ